MIKFIHTDHRPIFELSPETLQTGNCFSGYSFSLYSAGVLFLYFWKPCC